MKLLIENFRNFLKEDVDIDVGSGAFTPKDLPAEVFVKIENTSDEIVVKLINEEGEQFFGKHTFYKGDPVYGYVRAKKPFKTVHGACLDGYAVAFSEAAKGWGPMLYDIVMEEAGEYGLTADRVELSPDAYKVWEFYLKNRQKDVVSKQLDDLDNTLTPGEDEDNCESSSAEDHSDILKYTPSWIKPLRKKGLRDSPVMKMYVKTNRDDPSQSVRSQLKKLEKLR